MEVYQIENLSFSYSQKKVQVLKNINLMIKKGEFITICGQSGSGKSTLLRQLKTCLRPYGSMTGRILFCHQNLDDIKEREQAQKIGFVMQSPENQTVVNKVWGELAFGLESLGVKRKMIHRKMAEVSAFFGIESWYDKEISELSGGQKQILNLASVMMLNPEVIILDEPTAQLDPIAAEKFISLLRKINAELGVTVILSEHDLEKVFSISDRIIFMTDGRIEFDGRAEMLSAYLYSKKEEMFDAVPACAKIYTLLGEEGESPKNNAEARQWLSEYIQNKDLREIPEKQENQNQEVCIHLKNIFFRYHKDSEDILKNLSLKIDKGEIFSILGGNGTGKTTLLKIMAGIYKINHGKIMKNIKKIAYLPQNPCSLFSKNSVMDELTEITENQEKINQMIKLCEIEEILDRHPYDLSGGEQQKAAIAKILLTEPELLLLDEPVKGLDSAAKEKIAVILKAIVKKGASVILVSHDMEFCAEYSDRCGLFFRQNLVGIAETREFFLNHSFYTTAARKISMNIIHKAVTVQDILYALHKEEVYQKKTHNQDKEKKERKNYEKKKEELVIKNRPKKPFFFLLILCCIFMTIFAGIYFLNDKKYLFISMMIMLECMIPFFVKFEKKKLRTREIVLMAVMCSLCIISRAVFYMLPEFKPLTALVILSGVSLGSETGFIIGACSMLVSNMIFGQGPWTPWQMTAMGLIGFLSGILSEYEILKKNKILFSIYGSLAALLIYGGIMNPAAAIMSGVELNKGTLLAYFAAGFPLDLIHAVSTAIFIFAGFEPILRILERVKLKYGIL